MDFFLVHKIIIILINTVGLWLALWVYFADRKNRINQIFLVGTIILILWVDLGFLAHFSSLLFPKTYAQLAALWLTRLGFAIVYLFFILAYFFSIHFPKEIKRNYLLDKIYFSVCLIFFGLSLTPLIVKKVELGKEGVEITGGSGISFFLLMAGISIFLLLSNIFREYRLLSKREKLKLQYFVIGVILLAFFGFIFDIAIPALAFGGGVFKGSLYLFGHYSVIFFLLFTAYSIVKHHLFDIKVILTQLLVGTIAILLLVDVFFSRTTLEYIGRGIVFVIFLGFGYLLIKSVLKEIELKEELSQSYLKLRELTDTLEERVKERTKELERQKKMAEDRLKEVEEKKETLEKFQRLTVGRELRMVELKKEIKRLEEKLKEEEEGE